MNAKHNKRRSDQVLKMSSTSFHTSSSVKNIKSTADAGKRCSSFRARVRRNAQFATMSSCALRFFEHFNFKSDERCDISKSDEFLSLVKFYVWFCDSSVHLSDSKSIHWQNQRFHQCAHCEIVCFLNAFLYCQRFSFLKKLFRPETVKPLLRNSLSL